MVGKSLKSILVAVFSVILLGFSAAVHAQEDHGTKHETAAEAEFDAGQAILHHIADSHEWQFLQLWQITFYPAFTRHTLFTPARIECFFLVSF